MPELSGCDLGKDAEDVGDSKRRQQEDGDVSDVVYTGETGAAAQIPGVFQAHAVMETGIAADQNGARHGMKVTYRLSPPATFPHNA